jgi:predicted dehydrogenase
MGLAANLDHRGIPYIDNGKAIVQFENDALATVDFILSMHQRFPAGRGFHVIGDEGALTIEQDEDGEDVVAIYRPDGTHYRPIESWDGHTREVAACLEICREGGDPSEWQQEGLQTLDVITAWKQAYECCGLVHVGGPEPLVETGETA